MADTPPTTALGRDAPLEGRLESLLSSLAVTGLSTDEWRELSSLLDGDRGSIRRYVETIHMSEQLHGLSSGVGAASLHCSTPQRLSGDSKRWIAHHREKRLSRWRPGMWIMAASVAFVVGMVGGLCFDWAKSKDSAVASITSVPSLPTAASVGGLAFEPTSRLGHISGLSPEASSDGLLRSMQVGDDLRRGEVIQLDRGTLRLSLATSAEALVTGPAEFSVVDSGVVFLRSGRISMSGESVFAVQTPMVAARSTGGEFSVVAQRASSTAVFAHQGDAVIEATPGFSLDSGRDSTNASEGTGLEVHPSEARDTLLVKKAELPDSLVRTWDAVIERLHPYEQLVLDEKPTVYWPLYRVRRNRRVLDLTQNGFDGQAIGAWPSDLGDVASTQLRGAYFNGESYIEPDRKPPLNPREGFTIESWAKLSGVPEFQALFTSRWVFSTETPNEQCFGVTLYATEHDRWAFWSGSGEYGAGWQPLMSPEPVVRRSWTHVVATFDPVEGADEDRSAPWVLGVARLYVNGKQVAEAMHKQSTMDFEWPARIGAAEYVPKSLTSWLFRGELRDIALYPRVLSPDRVKAHFAAGQSAS
jgi:hypothetical protein